MFIKRIDILTLICLVVLFGVFGPFRLKDKYNIFMAEPNWGLLEKSQTSDETIEQAIDRLITAHNDDANAHIGAGKSLDTHKTQAVVDHPADSIVQDKIGDGQVTLNKLTQENRILISAFESLDCWLNNITGPNEIGSLIMQTTNAINTQKYMMSTQSGGVGLDWTKDFYYQTTIHITYDTTQLIYFGVGGTELLESASGAGFKILNGTIYAGVIEGEPGDYDSDWVEISGITLIGTHIFRVEYDQSAGTLKFFIDDVVVRTMTSGIPTTNSDAFLHYEIKNTDAVNRYIVLHDLIYQRPR